MHRRSSSSSSPPLLPPSSSTAQNIYARQREHDQRSGALVNCTYMKLNGESYTSTRVTSGAISLFDLADELNLMIATVCQFHHLFHTSPTISFGDGACILSFCKYSFIVTEDFINIIGQTGDNNQMESEDYARFCEDLHDKIAVQARYGGAFPLSVFVIALTMSCQYIQLEKEELCEVIDKALEDGVKKGCCDDVGFMEHRKIVSELLSQIRGVISSLLSILDDSERLFGISSALGVPREDDSVKKLFLLPIYHLFIAMKKHEVELESVLSRFDALSAEIRKKQRNIGQASKRWCCQLLR